LAGVPIVGFSESLATRYYGLALEFFWKHDLTRSERAITLAIAESPGNAVYRYWSVLAAIALGDMESARLKLRPLLAAEPYGSSTREVAMDLERVQGPLRAVLLNLEKELLLEGLVDPQSPVPPQPATAPYEEPADVGPEA
jgi:hypothetical protein